MKAFLILLIGLVGLSPAVLAMNQMEVVGLFKERAVIRHAGQDALIRVGETSNSGIKLVSADARTAVVEYRGERHSLSLSGRVSSSFQKAAAAEVSIPPDRQGQYRVRGSINGQYVDLLVDTGASVVAMSSAHAKMLGVDYLSGRPGRVHTAQGTTDSFFVILDELQVGGITGYNVEAAVIDGGYPLDVLLGMSFLRQVAMREDMGVLTLQAKH
jgi:aspartyl protease family protein